MPALKNIDVFGLTHVGKVRSLNEDQFLLASLRKEMILEHCSLKDRGPFERFRSSDAYLFLIADGVGGIAGGEKASGTAVETVARYVIQTAGCYYNYHVDREHEFLDQLKNAVIESHQIVREAYSKREQGAATTLTMVQLIWPRAYVVHIGDSRCYYLREGELKMITRDQTMGEEMLDRGLMSEEEVERYGYQNVLTSAVGAKIHPEIGLIDLEWNDVLLLCTDGLNKHVSDQRIRDILIDGGNAQSSCERLVNEALEGGGTDNVTVAVGRMIP